jgi:hypothetical protein
MGILERRGAVRESDRITLSPVPFVPAGSDSGCNALRTRALFKVLVVSIPTAPESKTSAGAGVQRCQWKSSGRHVHEASREWIDAECQLAIKHLIKVCGELHLGWNRSSVAGA